MKFDRKNQPFYEDYKGPVFLFETNIKLKDTNKKGYVYLHDTPPEVKPRPFGG
jgi:hypothetical protein